MLDTTSFHKLLYSLQIVERLLTPGKDVETMEVLEKRKQWINEFCKKGGMSHIYNALLRLPLDSIEHPLTRTCFRLILKLLQIVKSANFSFESFIPNFQETKEKLNERIFLLLESFAKFSVFPEKNNSPDKDEMSQRKYSEIEPDARSLQRQKQKQIDETLSVQHGLYLIQGTDAKKYSYFEQMTKFSHIKELILYGLILSDNIYMQSVFREELSNICGAYKNIPYFPAHPHVFLLPLLIHAMIKETLNLEAKCQEFYQLLSRIIIDINKNEFSLISINLPETLERIVDLLKSHEIRENKSTDTDYVLFGLLSVLEAFSYKFPEQNEFIGQKCGLVGEILHQFLFEFPKARRTEVALPPKCKSALSRRSSFSLLAMLAKGTPSNIKQIISFILPVHM